MKICSRHLHDLMQSIRYKGMGYLVTNDPQEARQRAEMWLAGNLPIEKFDPMVGATFEIYGKASELCGEFIERHRYNGSEPCPLCLVPKYLHDAGADTSWIENVTDALLVMAQVNHIPLRRSS